jgi:hypothetical protein
LGFKPYWVGKLKLPPQHLTPHPYILPELINLPFILFNFLYYLFYRSFTPFQKQHTPQQFNCSGKFNNVPVQYIYQNPFLIVPVFFFYYSRRRLLPEQREIVPVCKIFQILLPDHNETRSGVYYFAESIPERKGKFSGV